MAVSAVIFDIDNTFYNYTEGNRAAMEALVRHVRDDLHLDAEEFRAYTGEAYNVMRKRLAGRAACHNRLLRFQYVCRKMGLPDYPYAEDFARLYWQTLLDTAVPEPGLTELLKALKESGITVAAGTNMTAFIQFEKIRCLGIGSYIDRIYTSEETDAEKPSAPFFDYCVKDLGVGPEDCLFIGDDAVNDYGASTGYGLHGIWYAARPGAHPEEEAKVPEADTVHSFTECVSGGTVHFGDLTVTA